MVLFNACFIAEYSSYIKNYIFMWYLEPQNFRSVYYFAVLQINTRCQGEIRSKATFKNELFKRPRTD